MIPMMRTSPRIVTRADVENVRKEIADTERALTEIAGALTKAEAARAPLIEARDELDRLLDQARTERLTAYRTVREMAGMDTETLDVAVLFDPGERERRHALAGQAEAAWYRADDLEREIAERRQEAQGKVASQQRWVQELRRRQMILTDRLAQLQTTLTRMEREVEETRARVTSSDRSLLDSIRKRIVGG